MRRPGGARGRGPALGGRCCGGMEASPTGRPPPRRCPPTARWRTAAAVAAALLRVGGAESAEAPPGSWHKPWATHAGCAELVRRFDFNANFSEVVFRRFASCLRKRGELPDWHGQNRPALLAGEHFPVSVTPSPRGPPGFWVTPAWDYVVSNFIRREGTYEPGELQLFRALTEPGAVVCDVGAHVGAYALPLASHVGEAGEVHVFEPFRLVFQLLLANAALNGLANVHGHQVALGERPERRLVRSPALTRTSNIGATRIFGQVEPHFNSEHVLQYEGKETVHVITLDSLELERVDFVKVDVEGALEPVLRGAAETLRRERPVVAAEHEGDAAPPLLLDWGYHCVKVLPVHDLWACVPQERWQRFGWLGSTGTVLTAEGPLAEQPEVPPPPPRAEPRVERRRAKPPPPLLGALVGT